MAKVVAIANQKGGVGKTTAAVHRASRVADRADRGGHAEQAARGSSGAGDGRPERSVEVGAYQLLIDQADARTAIHTTPYKVDVIPSNTALAGAGVELVNLPCRESRLRRAIAGINRDYDFIFIDCPPSLDLITLNGLCAADTVLIPIQCEYYALEGLSELLNTLKTTRKMYNKYLDVEGVVFTMYSARYNLTIQVVDQVKQFFGDKVFKAVIPRAVRLSEAPSYGMPINYYDPAGKATKSYMELAGEFLKKNQK